MATRSRPARRPATRSKSSMTRKATSPSKRRPAARRKPAARRNGSRIRWDRVGRIALTLVLAAVLFSYLNPAIDLVKTYTATTAAKAEFHEKLRENKRLHNRIQTADDPMVIARKARAQGMVAEGETPIVVRGLGG
jgi:cell division protein FtsB